MGKTERSRGSWGQRFNIKVIRLAAPAAITEVPKPLRKILVPAPDDSRRAAAPSTRAPVCRPALPSSATPGERQQQQQQQQQQARQPGSAGRPARGAAQRPARARPDPAGRERAVRAQRRAGGPERQQAGEPLPKPNLRRLTPGGRADVPHGQNTKVDMRFNVLTAEFLPDWVKVIPTGPTTSLRPDPHALTAR